MEKQNLNQSFTHLHYHYHYYYPSNFQTTPHKDLNEQLSRSLIYERRKEDSFQFTPEPTKSKMQTQGNQTIASQKWAKMRMSQILNNNSMDGGRYYSQYPNIKAKSVVEEQLQPNEQERQKTKENLLPAGDNQKAILDYQENLQNSLVTYYEEELKKYRSEVERLKMVEEECVYLRDKFYNHYEMRCKDLN